MNAPISMRDAQRAFCRLSEAEQLRQIVGQVVEREFTLERASVDEHVAPGSGWR